MSKMMVTKQELTMSKVFPIPVMYWCSKCGKQNVVILPVYASEEESNSVSRYHKSHQDLMESMYRGLYCVLKRRIDVFYTDEASEHLIGVTECCEHCGNVEPWFLAPPNKWGRLVMKLRPLISLAWLIGSIFLSNMICKALGAGFLAGVAMFAALMIVFGIIEQKFLDRKVNDKEAKAALATLPPERKPFYLYDREVLKRVLDEKMEEAIDDLWRRSPEGFRKPMVGNKAEEIAQPESTAETIPGEVVNFCKKYAGDSGAIEKFLGLLLDNQLVSKNQCDYLMITYGGENSFSR